jgi:hypothetical protein
LTVQLMNKKQFRNIFLVVCVVLPVDVSLAQQSYPGDSQQLFAMARDLWAPVELQLLGYGDQGLSATDIQQRIRQSSVFLQAATEMDPTNAGAWYDLLVLLMSETINDPGLAMDALYKYSDLESEDELPVQGWIRYRLNSLNDRWGREYFLEKNMLPLLGSFAPVQSDVYVQLGILALEKGVVENVSGKDGTQTTGARQYFGTAFNTYIYNDEALARTVQLPAQQIREDDNNVLTESQREFQQKQIQDFQDLRNALRWRVRLRNNPYDLQAVLSLLEVLTETGQHKLALGYYDHAYRLMATDPRQGSPEQKKLKEEVSLKHLLSAYNSQEYRLAIQVAEDTLQQNKDDLLVSGMMVCAMKKLGLPEASTEKISREAADLAVANLGKQQGQDRIDALKELAWYFCFISPDAVRALDYAQQVVNAQPEFARGKAVLAYAYILNKMPEKARELLNDNADKSDPVVALTWAHIHQAGDDPQSAYEVLKVVKSNSAGILTEEIKILLQQLKPASEPTGLTGPAGQGRPGDTAGLAGQANPTSTARQANQTGQTTQDDIIVSTFDQMFDNKDLRIVVEPEKFIGCYLRLDKNVYNYGEPIMAKLYLTNIGEIELSMGPGSFLDPHVLITAQVKPVSDKDNPGAGVSSSATTMILSHRYPLQKRLLPVNRSNIVSEPLNIGQLRQLLDRHPQQSYQITFGVILDPAPDEKGGYTGRIAAIQPKPVTVTRKGFIPAQKRLAGQLKFLRSGSEEERIKTVELLGGLLAEAELARHGQLGYKPHPIDENNIRELIDKNLAHSDFRVRAWSTYALRQLPVTAGGKEVEKQAELLSDAHWLVRLLDMLALEPQVDLTGYLSWSSDFDANLIVKRQGRLLMNQPWQIMEVPFEIPAEIPSEVPSGVPSATPATAPATAPAVTPTATSATTPATTPAATPANTPAP